MSDALITGLVLAGGRGRRFGGPKALVRLPCGRTLAARAADVLEPLCARVLVSISPEASAPHPAPGRTLVLDRAAGRRGPLAGIDAGFAATGGGALLLLACDYPALEAPLLRVLLEVAAAEACATDVVLAVDGAGGAKTPDALGGAEAGPARWAQWDKSE